MVKPLKLRIGLEMSLKAVVQSQEMAGRSSKMLQ